MIDEKVLIERLEETRWTTIFDTTCIFENDKLDKCIKIVNQLAEESNLTPCYLGSPCEYQNEDAKMPMEHWDNGWIPCSERLPEEDKYVLCQCENGMFIGCIDSFDGEWRDDGYYRRKHMEAWQPLPAPYKQKEEKHNE